MPQLDPAVFLPQIFWLFILFGLVYLFIAHRATPKITQVLERRADRIADDLDEAASLQEKADEIRLAYERAQEEARTRATLTIVEKRDAIRANAEAEYNALSARLSADLMAAEKKIAAARARALDEVRDMSADICGEIVTHISGLKLDKKQVAGKVGQKFDAVREEANG